MSDYDYGDYYTVEEYGDVNPQPIDVSVNDTYLKASLGHIVFVDIKFEETHHTGGQGIILKYTVGGEQLWECQFENTSTLAEWKAFLSEVENDQYATLGKLLYSYGTLSIDLEGEELENTQSEVSVPIEHALPALQYIVSTLESLEN